MKKLALFIVLLFLCGMLFAEGQTEGKKSAEPVQLLWWNHMEPGVWQDMFKKFLVDFQGANPNIKVQVEFIRNADYSQKLPTAIAAGTAPDIFGQTYREMWTYHQNGAMDPITDDDLKAMGYKSMQELKDSWAPGALEDYAIDGKYYGFIWQYNIYSMLMNTNLFKDAGLNPQTDAPKTWDAFLETGKKLTKKDGARTVRQGVSFPYTSSSAWYLLELEPLMREMGGSIMNKDQTECLVNSEIGIKAMQTIKRRFDEGTTDKDISAAIVYIDSFATGEHAMMIGNQEFPVRFGTMNPAMKGVARGFMIPVYPGTQPAISTTSWAHVVNAQSKHKGEAWRLADFLTKNPGYQIQMTGNPIPRKGWGDLESSKQYIPDAAFWASVLQYAQPLGVFKKYNLVAEPIKLAMQEILFQGKDIKASLDKAKAEVDRGIK
jgi:ABC-type glycerol-3-phosphate transport system substrate-binding protein